MSTGITFNGTSYTVPAIGDASWGTSVSNYLIAIASGCLQKTGGTFTLGAEVDFGTTAGLKVMYVKSQASNTASSGVVQLSSTDSLCWRDVNNTGDLALVINSGNTLNFNGSDLADTDGGQTFSNKFFSDATCKFISSVDNTKALMFNLGGATTGTTMTLNSSHTDNRTLALPDVSDTLVGVDAVQTITNKSFNNTNTYTVKTQNFTFQDGSISTKQFKFIASGITAGNTRSLTVPDATDTLAALAATQTFTNKTLGNTNTFTAKVSNFTLQDGTDTTKQFNFVASSISTGTTRSLTVPNTSDTLAVLSLAQTFTNKTHDNTNVYTAKAANLTVQDGTDTTKQFKFIASSITTGTTRSLTVPDATDTLAVLGATQTLTNKTLDNTNSVTLKASGFTVQDSTDTSKQFVFNPQFLSSSTTRTLIIPNSSGTLALTDVQQTFVSKIFSDSTVVFGNVGDATKTLAFSLGGATTSTKMTLSSSHTAARTLSLPDVTDTLVARTTTDTLTNKTLTAPSITSGSFVNFLGQAAARLNDASTNYIGLQAPSSVTTYSITLPNAVPGSGQVLADAGAGNGVMTWVSPASSALVATGVDIGNGSNTRTATRTDLLGDVKGTTSSQSYTVTSASPGVFTVTSHGFSTGDKVYVTVTQNGFTANTTYWVNVLTANTFSLCSSLANAVAGTGITSSGTTAGTIIGGGFVLTSGVKGTLSSTAATAGYIGEIIQSSFNNVAITSSVASLTSIVLTPGAWNLSATLIFAGNGTVGFNGISLLTVTDTAGAGTTQYGINQSATVISLSTNNVAGFLTVPMYRVQVAAGATKTYYLNASSSSSSGTPAGYGALVATRPF